MKNEKPSLDQWMQEAKNHESASQIGMYLSHNGVVRRTARAEVRQGQNTPEVTGLIISRDQKKLEAAVAAAKEMEGIFYVRVWVNEGQLRVGDDIMLVLIGGDIRPHVLDAMTGLVERIKTECITEQEIFGF